MPSGRLDRAALLTLVVLFLASVGTDAQDARDALVAAAAAAEASTTPETVRSSLQPSYDVLGVEHGGEVVPYDVWLDWVPLLATTPDGVAWAFFSAQARAAEGIGSKRLYAARFDPAAAVWLPARPLPGGPIQFGPAEAVDADGVVHLVYSDRPSDAPDAFSTLVYTHGDGRGGWESPVPVAPDPAAGHQMMPSLAADAAGGLHLLWRDQRDVAPEARAASVANADPFASDLVDGAWSDPARVYQRSAPELSAGWPLLAADGDRLVAVWSIYQGTTAEEMRSPVRVDRSTRALAGGAWQRPETAIDRGDGETGGRLLDLAADPGGGVALVYGRARRGGNDLFLRRLASRATTWGADARIGSGDYGDLPSIGIGADGTGYVVCNNGRTRNVDVGGLVVPPGAGERAGPLLTVTPGEDGAQGRAALALAANGSPWLVYMHQPVGAGAANEIRVLRAARMTEETEVQGSR